MSWLSRIDVKKEYLTTRKKINKETDKLLFPWYQRLWQLFKKNKPEDPYKGNPFRCPKCGHCLAWAYGTCAYCLDGVPK
jgi:hypothetical protein